MVAPSKLGRDWWSRMIAGGLLFLCAMIAAIAAILQPAFRLGPLTIQIVAFAFALGGIIVIASGASKMKNGRTKTR